MISIVFSMNKIFSRNHLNCPNLKTIYYIISHDTCMNIAQDMSYFVDYTNINFFPFHSVSDVGIIFNIEHYYYYNYFSSFTVYL